MVLIDKNFNLLVDPRKPEVIERYGREMDDRKLYVVNEVCVQAIGAGDMVNSFFAQDPSIHGYEKVTIWEGKFRNYAKVKNSTRAWTTTIRFGQPKILDEDGKDYVYRYPQTILSDVQDRPNLPPPPYENPESKDHIWGYSLVELETGKWGEIAGLSDFHYDYTVSHDTEGDLFEVVYADTCRGNLLFNAYLIPKNDNWKEEHGYTILSFHLLRNQTYFTPTIKLTRSQT